jgi:Phosphate-selective porin O and P
MRNGFWKILGRMPALALAVAVAPAAVADGPLQYDNSAEVGPAGPSAIPVLDMHAFRPIQPVAAVSPAYDTNYAPQAPIAPVAPAQPAAPVAPVAPVMTAPVAAPFAAPVAAAPCAPICAPTCSCGPDGGCTFQWSPDKWCNVGLGIRTSFNSLQGNEVTDKNYFAVDEARLFFTGKVTSVIGFELNTDISGAGGDGFNQSVNLPDSIHLLDAIVKFEFNDYVNFWMGRMLPPSDRSNLSGPFYINGWDYPFVSNYPGVFEGRDDGVAYWGQWMGQQGGQLKWQFGLYNGQGRFGAGNDWPTGTTGPNTNGDPEFAMRVVVNLLDPEPGYYNASTYYGQKNIAAIGFALLDQPDALTDGVHTGTYLGWNLDFLLENKMTAWGSGTFEAAYYNYDVGGDVANDVAGKAGLLFAGWLLPQQIGYCGLCGRFRPWVRYQRYNYDDETVAENDHSPTREWDVGLDYVISCANARWTTFWGQRKDACGCEEEIFRTGVQLVF